MRGMKRVSLFFILLFIQTTIFGALPSTNIPFVFSDAAPLDVGSFADDQSSKVHPFTVVGSDLNQNDNYFDWYSMFPMLGALSLNNNTLNIHNDLVFSGTGNFRTLGTIEGNRNRIVLSPQTSAFPIGAPMSMADTSTVATGDSVHTVTAVAWSADGSYLFAAHRGSGSGNDRVEVYSYNQSGNGAITTEAILTGTNSWIANGENYSGLNVNSGPFNGGGNRTDQSVSCLSVCPVKPFSTRYLVAVGQDYAGKSLGGTNVNILALDTSGTTTLRMVSVPNPNPASATTTLYTATRVGAPAVQTHQPITPVVGLSFRPSGPWESGTSHTGSFLAVHYGTDSAVEGTVVYNVMILKIARDGRVEGEVPYSLPSASTPTFSKPCSNSITWSPDGSRLTLASDNKIIVYTVDNDGKIIEARTQASGNARVVAYHPHGDLILAGRSNDTNSTFKVYKYEAGFFTDLVGTSTLAVANNEPFVFHGLSFYPGGTVFAAATNYGVRLFNFNKDEAYGPNPNTQTITDFGVFYGGDTAAAGRRYNVHASVWSPEMDKQAVAQQGYASPGDTDAPNLFVIRYNGGNSIQGGTLKDVTLSFNTKTTLNSSLRIQENTVIDGHGSELVIPAGVQIFVDSGKKLTFKNTLIPFRGRLGLDGNGIERMVLDNIQFADGTSELELNHSVARLETDVYITQGIITVGDGSGIDTGGLYAYDRARTVSVRGSGGGPTGGRLSNHTGATLTLTSDTIYEGDLESIHIIGGGKTLTFENSSGWPGGEDLTIDNATAATAPSGDNAFTDMRVDDLITSPDKQKFAYVNKSAAAAGTATVRVDHMSGDVQTKLVEQTITGGAGNKDGNIFQLAWRSGGFRTASGSSDPLYDIVVAHDGTQAELSINDGADHDNVVAEMYAFNDGASKTFTKVSTGQFKVGSAESTLQARGMQWKNKDFCAVGLSNPSGSTNYIRLYQVDPNGTVRNNTVADSTRVKTVTLPTATTDSPLTLKQVKWMAEMGTFGGFGGGDSGGGAVGSGPGGGGAPRNLVWATGNAVGLVRNRDNALTNVGLPINLTSPIIAPHPHDPFMLAIASTGLSGNVEINMYFINAEAGPNVSAFTPMMGATFPLVGNATTVNEIRWDVQGEGLIVSTDAGCQIYGFDPSQGRPRTPVSGGTLGSTVDDDACNTALMLDSITLVRDTAVGDDDIVVHRFTAGEAASLKNVTIKNPNWMQLKGTINIEENTIFDGMGTGSFSLLPTTNLYVKSGKTVTFRNAFELSGLEGRPDGNGNFVLTNITFEDSTAKIVLDGVPIAPFGPVYIDAGTWDAGSGTSILVRGIDPISVGPNAVFNHQMVPDSSFAGGSFVAMDAGAQNFVPGADFGRKSNTFESAGEFGSSHFPPPGQLYENSLSRGIATHVPPGSFEFAGDMSFTGDRGSAHQWGEAAGDVCVCDFQSGAASLLEYKGAVAEIVGQWQTKGTGREVLDSGAAKTLKENSVMQVGDVDTAATDTFSLELVDGSRMVAESGSRASMAYGTNEITATSAEIDMTAATAWEINGLNGTGTSGSTLSSCSMHDSAVSGCMHWYPNDNDATTSFDVKGLRLGGGAQLCYGDDDAMVWTAETVIGDYTPEQFVRIACADKNNPNQCRTTGGRAVCFLSDPENTSAAPKQIVCEAGEEVVQLSQVNGAKGAGVATVNQVVTQAVILKADGTRERITTDSAGARVLV